jgi:hypothetical protein
MTRNLSTLMSVVAGATLLLSTVSPAVAQKAKQACAPDIHKFCGDVQPGEGHVAECLRAHEPQLSPACKGAMAMVAGQVKEVVQACEDDVHRFCAGAPPGTTKACLKANFRNLSFECKKELFQAKRHM